MKPGGSFIHKRCINDAVVKTNEERTELEWIFYRKLDHWEAGQQKHFCTWEARIRRKFVQDDEYIKSHSSVEARAKRTWCATNMRDIHSLTFLKVYFFQWRKRETERQTNRDRLNKSFTLWSILSLTQPRSQAHARMHAWGAQEGSGMGCEPRTFPTWVQLHYPVPPPSPQLLKF